MGQGPTFASTPSRIERLMPTALRLATFNIENLDEPKGAKEPALEDRIRILRPQLLRLRAERERDQRAEPALLPGPVARGHADASCSTSPRSRR